MRPLVARASGAALALASVVAACTSASSTGDDGVAGGVDGSGANQGAGGAAAGSTGQSAGGHGTMAPDGGVTSFPDGSSAGGTAGAAGAVSFGPGGHATGGKAGSNAVGPVGQGGGGVGPVGPGPGTGGASVGGSGPGGGGGFNAGPGGGPPCVPQCTGKQCGPDGCNLGGLCGTCASTSTCDASGICECTPQCAGKQCGSDSCTGQCGPGCTSTQACDASGQCISTSMPTWSKPALGATVNRLALDASGSPLYAAGALAGSGWLAAIDVGSGSQLVEVNVGAPPSSLGALKAYASQIMVGGYETFTGGPNGAEGSFQMFTPGTLVTAGGLEPLYGSMMLDEVLDVALIGGPDSVVWMTGATNLAASGQTGGIWGIVQSQSVSACGFPSLPGIGASRSVLPLNGATYLLAVKDGQGAIAQYDATAACTGIPLASALFSIGAASTDPRQMVAVGGVLYVAGNADDGGAPFGFLAAIDATTLTVTSSYRDVVSERRYQSLATDGTQLCVGGSQGSIGYVGLWTTSFGSVWAAGGALPAGTDVVNGIACDSTSLYAGATNGTIAKCTMAGICP